ncbi:MAG: hypothetical protein LH628_21455 [Microcoleus sp. CAN_BIN18]|nr:hypothetical protein [Microcoleus sp. CAN_BIN18]
MARNRVFYHNTWLGTRRFGKKPGFFGCSASRSDRASQLPFPEPDCSIAIATTK